MEITLTVLLHKEALRPHRLDASGRAFALIQASTAKDDPTRSFRRESLGDGQPKTLSSSRADRDRCSVS